MFHTCNICLEDVVIPVEITVFRCGQSHERNCYSFHRQCEKCVISYLELDKKPQFRSSLKKCLFCDETINPREIMEDAYKKDFLFMSIDSRMISCSLCEFEGSHLDLEKHATKECKNQMKECPCGLRDKRSIVLSEDHKKDCCFFKECLVCHCFIYIADMEKHYALLHRMEVCNICSKPTSLSLLEHKNQECPMRNLQCRHCHSKMMAHQYIDHVMDHASESKNRLTLLTDVLQKENKLYQRYTQEIRDLFEFTYGIPYESSL